MSLADLEREARELEAAGDPRVGSEEPVPEAPPAAPPATSGTPEQWRGVVRGAAAIIVPNLPEKARAAWTPANMDNLGDALAQCAAHYGWSLSGILSHPLLALGAAAMPMLWPLIEPRVMPYLETLMLAGKSRPEE